MKKKTAIAKMAKRKSRTKTSTASRGRSSRTKPTATQEDKMHVLEVTYAPLDQLQLKKKDFYDNPREFVDTKKVRELADDIAQRGLTTPLRVADRDGQLIVLGGGRRFRAIHLLVKEKRANGLKEGVPIVFVDAEDSIAARFEGLADNLHRENLSSYETAKEIFGLSEAGVAQKDIAEKLGKSAGWVSRLLGAYKKSTPTVHKAWSQGKVPDDDVQTLVKLPRGDQDKRLAAIMEHRDKVAAAKPGQVRKAKEAARAAAKGKPTKNGSTAPMPRVARPDYNLIRTFADITSKAPKSNKYIQGMRDAFLFALGEIGPGELGKDFTGWAERKGFGTGAPEDTPSALPASSKPAAKKKSIRK